MQPIDGFSVISKCVTFDDPT